MARTKDPELEQRRRLQILATTRRLLIEGSHATLTLDRVAAEAGVSKGMLTYYFASKEQLVTEAMHQFLREQELMLGAIAAVERPPRERLRMLVAAALPSREALDEELRMQIEVLSFAKQSPSTLAAVRRLYREFRRACEALLERGVREGAVTARDATQVYPLLHALIDGLSFQIVFDPDLDLDEVRERALAVVESLLLAREPRPAANRPGRPPASDTPRRRRR